MTASDGQGNINNVLVVKESQEPSKLLAKMPSKQQLYADPPEKGEDLN
jgi:hypothetical protein